MRKIKIVFLITSCRKTGPIQQMLNIIKYLDKQIFDAVLITLYDEIPGQSELSLFESYIKIVNVPTPKIWLVFGSAVKLKNFLKDYNPDVIHSHGVIPDYAVARIGKYNQIHTIRNYMWDDYLDKFGRILGNVLIYVTLFTNKRAKKTLVCSKSLSDIYMDKRGMKFDYIQNGIDIGDYTMPKPGEKEYLRKMFNLPQNAFLFIYAGSFLARKNMPFLIDTFQFAFFNNNNVCLILLGDGVDLLKLKEQYERVKNIKFFGNVPNVCEYLKACDAFVSASKSEGLPNSVLEALSSGLPVILSDIPQHLEIINTCKKIGEIGYSYKQGDRHDMAEKLKKIIVERKERGVICHRAAQELFSAEKMSKKYQKIYMELGRISCE